MGEAASSGGADVVSYQLYDAHLPEGYPLPELAPAQAIVYTCRLPGFVGPSPPPVSMSEVVLRPLRDCNPRSRANAIGSVLSHGASPKIHRIVMVSVMRKGWYRGSESLP